MTTNNTTNQSGIAPAAANVPTSYDPYSLRRLDNVTKPKPEETTGTFPTVPIIFAFAIAAPVTLVGLPLAALTIVTSSGCCTNQSLADFLTFWGSLFTGMLALFGSLIAAVFVISAFRIDKSAKAEARAAASKSVGKFILDYRTELLTVIDKWAGDVAMHKNQAIETINAASAEAVERINAARGAAESASERAVTRIDAARTAAESASEEAVTRIEGERDEVVERGRLTAQAMDQSASDVADQGATAIERIGEEVAEVERVAAEARDRIEGQQPDQPPPSDSQD